MTPLFRCIAITAALAAAPWAAHAQSDRNAERAARRQQLQLQAAQQQVQAAQAEKAQAESERDALKQQLQGQSDAAAKSQTALRAADGKLKALEAESSERAARIAELEKTLQALRRSSEDALAAKDRELAVAAAQSKRQTADQGELQERFAQQVRLVTECTEKNERLVHLGTELIDRYRDKGVLAALRNTEPLTGLADVGEFNLVQDWRDKADAERFVRTVERH